MKNEWVAPSNIPVWTSLVSESEQRAKSMKTQPSPFGFHEVWHLKLNDPQGNQALWLRFNILSSSNGFRRVAETWAVFFQKNDQKETNKVALKQAFDIQHFKSLGEQGIRIGDCEFTANSTKGSIQSKGRTIEWDLKFAPAQAASFNLVPQTLSKMGLVKGQVGTIGEDLRFEGTSSIDGVKTQWTAAPGMQGHWCGPKNSHAWVWGHCNAFVNEQGVPVPFVFEGLTARTRLLGPIPTPQLSSFYFLYQGKEYVFNSVMDALRARSQNSLTEWQFQVDRGDISFRGKTTAQHRDFAGLTLEDTDASLLYCNTTQLADMTVLVYRRGKLEATLTSRGTASFDVATRGKNPYVPILV